MLEKIISLDQSIFVFLNGLGSETFDQLWLMITKQVNWTPLFLIVFYLLYKKIGGKNLLILILTIAVLITFTDQFTNLIKNHFQRLRPCNNPNIKDFIRIVKSSDTFSYFSGHAANSMATTVLVFLIFKKHYKFSGLLFIFPLIFAYSRIYLGLHYPLDIISGYIFGGFSGLMFYKIYHYFRIQTKQHDLLSSHHE